MRSVFQATVEQNLLLSSTEITDCFDHAIGVASSAKIPDGLMTASSENSAGFKAAYGRLNGTRGDGWCAGTARSNKDWLEVNLGELRPHQLSPHRNLEFII